MAKFILTGKVHVYQDHLSYFSLVLSNLLHHLPTAILLAEHYHTVKRKFLHLETLTPSDKWFENLNILIYRVVH